MSFDDKFSAEEEKIMNEIRKETENIDVPASLSPENMMKKIQENKKKKNENKNEFKNQFKNESEKKKKKRFPVRKLAAIAASVSIFVTAGFGIYFKGDDLFSRTVDLGVNVDKELEKSGSNDIINKTSLSISNVGTKEEIVKLLQRQYKKNNSTGMKYSNNTIYDGYVEEAAGESELEGDVSNDSTSSDDYYKNNDQVEGVIEGDVIVNDGKYIYIIKSDQVYIIKTEGEKTSVASKISLSELADFNDTYLSLEKIFVNDDKLIVVAMKNTYYYCYEYDDCNEEETYSCNYRDNFSKTLILEYDIKDRTNPKYINNVEMEGGYSNSRMVDDNLYVITNRDSFCYYGEEYKKVISDTAIPLVDGEEVPADRIYGTSDNEYNDMMIIAGFDIANEVKTVDTSVIMMYSGEVYVSNDNIYVVQNIYDDGYTLTTDGVNYTYQDKSLIYKFGYDNGEITPIASTGILGSVLNQFSMDEKDGYFRLVASISRTEYGRTTWNSDEMQAIYIFDNDLEKVGYLDGIAPDEQIKSVRFMDDKVYFVTFVQTDPLFVADIKDPTNPVILDELKVSGFSTYLHDWGNGLLLGIGSEADENTGVVTGFKMSMFSIKDDDLEEVSKIVFDSAYGNSWDYKDMLVDAKKNLIGVNVESTYQMNEYDISYQNHYKVFTYENDSFNEILDYNNIDDNNDDYYYNNYRGLYIGNYLYIITLDKGIVAFDLNSKALKEYTAFD